VKEGSIGDAIGHYHRAIYGQWSGDPRSSHIETRFELADLLNREGSRDALLSELLPIELDVSNGGDSNRDEAVNAAGAAPQRDAGNIAMLRHLANLFVAAGSPSRAATILLDLLRTDSDDAGLHADEGEAEFALRNYDHAETQFRDAVRLDPSDAHAQHRLQLCDEILRLNPTSRGLSPSERYERSRDLVEYVRNDVNKCLGPNVPPDGQALMQAIDSAKRANITLEDSLAWAGRLWQLRKNECKQPISEDEQPAALVLAMPGNR